MKVFPLYAAMPMPFPCVLITSTTLLIMPVEIAEEIRRQRKAI